MQKKGFRYLEIVCSLLLGFYGSSSQAETALERKAEAEADKAEWDAEQSKYKAIKEGAVTPIDPSKYQAGPAEVPKLEATVNAQTFALVEQMSQVIAAEVTSKLDNTICPKADKPTCIVLNHASGATALLALERSATTLLTQAAQSLEVIKQTTVAPPPLHGGMSTRSLPLLALIPIAQTGMSFAAAMRPTWGSSFVSTKDLATGLITPLTLRSLSGSGRIAIYDPTRAIAVRGSGESEVEKLFDGVGNAIAATRKPAVDLAFESVAHRRKAGIAAAASNKEEKEREEKEATALEAELKALQQKVAEASKLLAALTDVSAAGSSALEGAIKGERLRILLKDKKLYTFDLALGASASDLVATNRLFSGLKVYAGTSSVANWTLYDTNGQQVAAGAVCQYRPTGRVAVGSQESESLPNVRECSAAFPAYTK